MANRLAVIPVNTGALAIGTSRCPRPESLVGRGWSDGVTDRLYRALLVRCPWFVFTMLKNKKRNGGGKHVVVVKASGLHGQDGQFVAGVH